MNYIYTNEELDNIFGNPYNGYLDWERFGSSASVMIKAVNEGFQQEDESGCMITFIPIVNESEFNLTLGKSLYDLNTEGKFIKFVSEDFAIKERDRLKLFNTTKALELAKMSPPSDSELLQMLIEIEADKAGGVL